MKSATMRYFGPCLISHKIWKWDIRYHNPGEISHGICEGEILWSLENISKCKTLYYLIFVTDTTDGVCGEKIGHVEKISPWHVVKWKISPHDKCEETLSHGEISPHEKCGDKSVKWKISPHEKGGENLSRGEISPHERCAENMSSGKILHMINVEKNL